MSQLSENCIPEVVSKAAFVVHDYDAEFIDMPELLSWRYKVIDVIGNGNCGYYSLNLGLAHLGLLPPNKLTKNIFCQAMMNTRKKLAGTLSKQKKHASTGFSGGFTPISPSQGCCSKRRGKTHLCIS